MTTREELERREEGALAPWAAHSGRGLGRRHPEPEHPYRTAFQRDRDRVIHSSAFRRLEYKTQVFLVHEGDHYRTRLTHSLEAAQIARTVARALCLNEDLCEVLALAHDLGHPPFGHAGQEELRECMREHGGFEHNLQGLRIVEQLERRYPAFPGLNLTFETRESMRKHTVGAESPVEPEYRPEWAPLLEAQVVDYADSIAYLTHDIDDAVHSGLLRQEDLEEVELWREGVPRELEDAELRAKAAVRAIIDRLVTDLVETTRRTLRERKIDSLEAVRRAKSPLVGLSPEAQRRQERLREFLMGRVYRHHQVVKMNEKARRILRELFRAYLTNADQLAPRFREWAREVGIERAVADYVAGMTDRFAQAEYGKLFMPFENIL